MGEESTIRAIHASLLDGPAWHGPAVLTLLHDATPKQAAAHPIPGVHSIWEILLHMNAWQEFALRAMQHQEVSSLDDAEDWPPVTETSADAWNKAIDQFKKTNQRIRELLEDYDNQALRETVPGQEYPMKVLLHGLAHHNAYHAGQIALLKKAAR